MKNFLKNKAKLKWQTLENVFYSFLLIEYELNNIIKVKV